MRLPYRSGNIVIFVVLILGLGVFLAKPWEDSDYVAKTVFHEEGKYGGKRKSLSLDEFEGLATTAQDYAEDHQRLGLAILARDAANLLHDTAKFTKDFTFKVDHLPEASQQLNKIDGRRHAIVSRIKKRSSVENYKESPEENHQLDQMLRWLTHAQKHALSNWKTFVDYERKTQTTPDEFQEYQEHVRVHLKKNISDPDVEEPRLSNFLSQYPSQGTIGEKGIQTRLDLCASLKETQKGSPTDLDKVETISKWLENPPIIRHAARRKRIELLPDGGKPDIGDPVVNLDIGEAEEALTSLILTEGINDKSKFKEKLDQVLQAYKKGLEKASLSPNASPALKLKKQTEFWQEVIQWKKGKKFPSRPLSPTKAMGVCREALRIERIPILMDTDRLKKLIAVEDIRIARLEKTEDAEEQLVLCTAFRDVLLVCGRLASRESLKWLEASLPVGSKAVPDDYEQSTFIKHWGVNPEYDRWLQDEDSLRTWIKSHPTDSAAKFLDHLKILRDAKFGDDSKEAAKRRQEFGNLNGNPKRSLPKDHFKYDLLFKPRMEEMNELEEIHPALQEVLESAEKESERINEAAKNQEKGDFTAAKDDFVTAPRWSVRGALFREASKERLQYLITPQSYKLPKGAKYKYPGDVDAPMVGFGTEFLRPNGDFDLRIQIGKEKGKNHENVGEVKNLNNRAVAIIDEDIPPLKWQSPQRIQFDMNNFFDDYDRTLVWTGSDAIRKLASYFGYDEVKKMCPNFPYPWPVKPTTIIKFHQTPIMDLEKEIQSIDDILTEKIIPF
ncbi:MAG: hypothetical protein CMI32_02085 [Opitutales bacterium]|mgnify:CR=1 FL=1|nr:hypothetical protein [Opitutales bacterium]